MADHIPSDITFPMKRNLSVGKTTENHALPLESFQYPLISGHSPRLRLHHTFTSLSSIITVYEYKRKNVYFKFHSTISSILLTKSASSLNLYSLDFSINWAQNAFSLPLKHLRSGYLLAVNIYCFTDGQWLTQAWCKCLITHGYELSFLIGVPLFSHLPAFAFSTQIEK